MATYLAQSPYDNSIYQNFLQWAQTIGTGLAAIGLKKVSDPGTVNWSSLTGATFAPELASNITPVRPTTFRFQGAWLTGIAYTGGVSAGATNDVVTFGGVTYMC